MLYNYFKSFIYSLIIIIGSGIILTIFNYFNILNGNLLKIIELLVPIISIFVGSYLLGKSTSKKGYIEGIKYSIIWIILFLLFNLITKNFTIISLLYFAILLFISILGSILGINKRKE